MPKGMDNYLAAALRQDQLLAEHYPNRGKDKDTLSERQATAGVCFALSSMWIRRHKDFKSEGPAKRMEFLSTEATIIDAMQTQMFAFSVQTSLNLVQAEAQKIVDTGIAPEGAVQELCHIRDTIRGMGRNERSEKALEIYGLASTSINMDELPIGATNMKGRIAQAVTATSGVHNYHLISIVGDDGGHSVCCYKTGGSFLRSAHLYFFDPNRGEYKVPSSKVSDFITAFLAHSELKTVGKLKTISVQKITG